MAYLGELKDGRNALEEQIAELVIYSEGSVSINEAWAMSQHDKAVFIKILNKYNQAKSGENSNEQL